MKKIPKAIDEVRFSQKKSSDFGHERREAESKKSKVKIFNSISDALKHGYIGQIFSTKGADRLYVITKHKWGKSGQQTVGSKTAKGFSSKAIPSAYSDVKKYSNRVQKKHAGRSGSEVKEENMKDKIKSIIEGLSPEAKDLLSKARVHKRLGKANSKEPKPTDRFARGLRVGSVSNADDALDKISTKRTGPYDLNRQDKVRDKIRNRAVHGTVKKNWVSDSFYKLFTTAIIEGLSEAKDVLKKARNSKNSMKESKGGRNTGRLSLDQMDTYAGKDQPGAEKEVRRRARTQKMLTRGVKNAVSKRLQSKDSYED